MSSVYDLLKGNDLRSIGKSDEVVALYEGNPALFDELFDGIFHEDKVIRARCADAVEKIARRYPLLLHSKKTRIIKHFNKFTQKEVVWHIALMTGFMDLNKGELEKTINQLMVWLSSSDSIIVKVACMQSLADQSLKHKSLIKSVCDEISRQMIFGSPAIKARGRHLLKKLSGSFPPAS